jgi:nitric oxide reductase NorD protein
MPETTIDPLAMLHIASPATAGKIRSRLEDPGRPLDADILSLIVNDTIGALAQETSFGESLAEGYAVLVGRVSREGVERYHRLVREASASGPTLGRLMAEALVPILVSGDDDFLNRFREVVRTMLAKGSYTLPPSLNLIGQCLSNSDIAGAGSYLTLLDTVFQKDMTYNRSRSLSYLLPKVVGRFPALCRAWQVHEVTRVARADLALIDPFLENFGRGPAWLNKAGLHAFVSQGLDRLQTAGTGAEKFLSLASRVARDACSDLQVAARLSQEKPRLDRYLQARTGQPLRVKPSVSTPNTRPVVFSDGRFVYLPEEIHQHPTRAANQALYKTLVRLEAGYYDCETFNFDLDKALARWSVGRLADTDGPPLISSPEGLQGCSELERFFSLFTDPALAGELFTIIEHRRIYRWMGRCMPGAMRSARPALLAEARQMAIGPPGTAPLLNLYRQLALEETFPAGGASRIDAVAQDISVAADNLFTTSDCVETSAELVARFYQAVADVTGSDGGASCPRLAVPFGRGPRPDLVFSHHRHHEESARSLQCLLLKHRLPVYRSDVKKRLQEQNGRLSNEDIQALVLSRGEVAAGEAVFATALADVQEALGAADRAVAEEIGCDGGAGQVFRYREWDCQLQDYLHDHVRVRKVTVAGIPSDFYRRTLDRYRGLVKRIRHSFEIIKPEGLKILRKWQEGDAFDYRALLDFAIDRRAGITPSDRIYLKRLKQERDVSVLVLVDLSRSTANAVSGSDASVLDLEKAAIVLLCEALSIVGDTFSIAGFSGTGRLGVDYYQVKDFGESMNDVIRQRICAMAPQRSTRMGAAIRHAVSELDGSPSKVKLLLILGDGFPNDRGYKQEYAVEDTRRAISEARSRNICTYAITVNVAADAGLDQLYGKIRHSVISDVRELPDKLFSIYSSLTRLRV